MRSPYRPWNFLRDDFKRSMTYPCPRSLDESRAFQQSKSGHLFWLVYNFSIKVNMLRKFNMSGWTWKRLNPCFLNGFPNLSFLNVSNCMLSQVFRYDKRGEFQEQSKNLHTLNLSHNTLSEDHLHPNLFRKQIHLVKLYLNNFRYLPRSIEKLKKR